MALLKDLTVFGATNLISDTFANNIWSNGFHHNAHDNNDAVLLAGGGYQAINTLLGSGYWADKPITATASTTTTPQFARIGLGAAVNSSYSVNANGTILSTASPGFANDVAASYWAYTRFKSGTTSEWHVGTNSSTAGILGEANAFEIRSAKSSYTGIAVRSATSSYGKLVVTVPSGETTIGLWSKISNQTKPQWVFGLINTTSNNFGWYNVANAASSGTWVANLSPSGSLYLGNGTSNTTDYKIYVDGSGYYSSDIVIEKENYSTSNLTKDCNLNGLCVSVNSHRISFGIGTGGVNRGIYDKYNDKWMIYTDSTNIISNYGALIPGSNNSQALGTTSLRWSKLYIGSANSYGSTSKPIYWNNGVPAECSISLNASVNSGTKNTMAYYSETTTISSATNIYATTNSLAINSTSITSGYNFQVLASSLMRLIAPQTTNTYDLGTTSLRWKSTYNVDEYIGTTSGSQCHLNFDNTNKCLRFTFD